MRELLEYCTSVLSVQDSVVVAVTHSVLVMVAVAPLIAVSQIVGASYTNTTSIPSVAFEALAVSNCSTTL